MKRGNSALCMCAIGALVLAFGCGRQAFAQSIKDLNNGQIGNGKFEVVPPNTSPAKQSSVSVKPLPGALAPVKPVVPAGNLKLNPKPNPTPATPIPIPPPTPGANLQPLPWPPVGNHPNPWHPSIQLQVPMPAYGHYEMVTETVLLEPEHIEKFWVQPEYQTVLDPSGTPQLVKVKGGYMAERLVPARFATIQRQVWVQDCPGNGFELGFKF